MMDAKTIRRLGAWVSCAIVVAWAVLVTGLTSPAAAEANPPAGTDLSPVLGYSTWSALRFNVNAAADEAEALALQTSGLEALGYTYVNQDDGWYGCPGSQGPDVDGYGRWVTDSQSFPPGVGGENGIAVVADYVHGLGLKFGIYVTPGISKQAVAAHTPVLGTHYTADQIATTRSEANYNCSGMVGLNYQSPGAQAFVNSVVDEFAQWGVDFIKLDGIQDHNAPDIRAWSGAIRQSGRPMQLDVTEGRFGVGLANTLDRYATQWEQSTDIECYGCESGGSYPLTDYSNVALRFNALAKWRNHSGSRFGGYIDFDSVEIGNCADDGLSLPARETVLSLWALASSPLLIGADLTNLCSTDLNLLKNTAVLSLDQDGITASRIIHNHGGRVVAKSVGARDAVVGLFNTGEATQTMSSSTSLLHLPGCPQGFTLTDLWSNSVSSTRGSIRASVAPEGVALIDVRSRC
jgi:hypothetical protein